MPDSPVHIHALSAQARTILLATDRQQSVIAEVVGGNTGSIAYTAYGRQSAQQNIATSLGFNGELRETRVGWYLLGNGYRAYNPTLMRFHSPDSWSPFRGGGLNAYMYCAGDPINFSDPTGHMPKGFFSKLRNLGSKTVAAPPEAPLAALERTERTAMPNQYQTIQSPSSSTSPQVGANTTSMPSVSPTHEMVRLPQRPPSRQSIGQQNVQALPSSSHPDGMITSQERVELTRPQVQVVLVNQQGEVVWIDSTPKPRQETQELMRHSNAVPTPQPRTWTPREVIRGVLNARYPNPNQ
jgi:RHS repeat-associated protein